MAKPKMLILRGNSAPAGNYPDEKGDTNVAWPVGALHVQPAKDYATSMGYDPIVLDKPGQPQSQDSPQAKAAIAAFLGDPDVTAFYGFSGGGYQLWPILTYLAWKKTESLHRIDRVVVLGAPSKAGKHLYTPPSYNAIARKRVKGWKDADWDVIYRKNPDKSQLPKGLPEGVGTHMFCPEVLLAGWPE